MNIKTPKDTKYIFFDCMETLIDMDPIPSGEDYALWSYQDSGMEGLWGSYAEFLAEYNSARATLNRLHADLTEDSFAERFKIMCERHPLVGEQNIKPQAAAERLTKHFLQTYYACCFVHEDVREILPRLNAKYKLGVVSNFKAGGGIQTMIKTHGLAGYFEFILTSIDFGFRKPHPSIYKQAIKRSGISPPLILFIGDDVQNDIIVPATLGMQTLLFDRYGKYDSNYPKIKSFHELTDILGI
jgi:putative hydrolase of the HAD superfamily